MIVHHPLAYQIGPLNLTGFGLAVLLAFIIGQFIGERVLRERGYDPDIIGDVVFAAVIGTLVGAKVYYVILTGDIHTLFSRGGFVFWGGLAGGVLGGMIAIKRRRWPIMRIADAAGIGIAAGYSIGRTGCWAVGDDYGRPWNGPLAVQFPQGAPPSTAANMHAMFGTPVPAGASPSTVLSVYPTQLLEVLLGFIMFLILWRLRNHRHAEGWLFGLYMVLAGIERFLVEFLRAKDDRFLGPLTVAQAIAIAVIIGGIIWMNARARVRAGAPGITAAAA